MHAASQAPATSGHARLGPPAGYLHPRYAESLSEWGRVRRLDRSGAWLLVRPIPGTDLSDALVGYRYLLCQDWQALAPDLNDAQGIVTALGVTDPFAGQTRAQLGRAFPDLVEPYKASYVVDLRAPAPSRHHRNKARKARSGLDIEVELDALRSLDTWEGLYVGLRERHDLRGLPAFSRRSFAQQLATPGCLTLGAYAEGRCVAMMMCFVHDDVAYSHLTAADDEGYRRSAAYALNDAAIELFGSRGMRWLDLGGPAGVRPNPSDGLAYFKHGWSSETRQTYLCGRIYDARAYGRLADRVAGLRPGFFPAYRAPAPG